MREGDFEIVESPNLVDISNEWDQIATLRLDQIDSRTDISYWYVLVPSIERLLGDVRGQHVLDVGCGTGHLSAIIASSACSVTGLDVSGESIHIARSLFGSRSNLGFEKSSPCEKAGRSHPIYSAAIANMVLSDMPTLINELRAIRKLLEVGAPFSITIPHPWFWPVYWGYSSQSWFNYSKELAIRAPFRITNDPGYGLLTTHFHRPLTMYYDLLQTAGFVIDRILEPEPVGTVPENYLSNWRFPRFLGIRCLAR